MPDRIKNSVVAARGVRDVLDQTPESIHAASAGHHLVIGPGDELTSAWRADGLELPDLPAMRRYRVDRIQKQLRDLDYGGIVLFDPLNVRYATDSTNMQLWVMHNGARYAFVSVDGYVIIWDYVGTEFLSGHSEVVDEVRPAIGSTFFLGGRRWEQQAKRWSAEMIEVIEEHCGRGARIAVDQCHRTGYLEFAEAGIMVGEGTEVMELARMIKSPDEIKAMRCAAHACQTTMGEMSGALRPGMTEREVWAMLHAGNIARAGEWIETQILSSGPRTNPWMQEASARVISKGETLAYDTDLVGAYGMMIDISRTWVVGGQKPTRHQQTLIDMARDMVAGNAELLTPGRSFRELTFDSFVPSRDKYRHYSVIYHGVGQCDEYPSIYMPWSWDEWGHDGVLEPGMVLTSESFIGSRDGGEGVKLEDQYLVTETGPELLTDFPLDLCTETGAIAPSSVHKSN